MTSNQEEYLKIIYEKGGFGKRIPNKIIAEELSISPASVTEMLSRLSSDGLINYKPYGGSKLTEEGVKACIQIIKSHKLWEVFLMRHLNYTWREAHEDAHLLEHISCERLVSRLDLFLDFPKTCPHGGYIPRENIEDTEVFLLKTLNSLEVGDIAVISRIQEDGVLLDYATRCGIKLNTEIKIISKEEYEGAINFLQEDKQLSISFKASTQILCKIVEH
ncbi:MAG: metal-dependent transcriptional regulator [bacterium]